MPSTPTRWTYVLAAITMGILGCSSPPIVNDDAGSGGGAGGGTGGAIEDAGTPAKAELSPASLDFAAVGCGTSATPLVVTLKNSGGQALTFNATIGTSTVFSVSPASGSVEPGASISLSVGAAVPQTATAGAPSSGTLTVSTSDEAHASLTVPLTLAASGATLTLSPGVASFGLLPVGSQAPSLPLTLANTGNAAAVITFAQPSDAQFSLSWSGAPGQLTIDPGASNTSLLADFTPTATSPSSTSAAITVAGAVCGASTAFIPMTGRGTNGVVGFSTAELFFGAGGLVDCGTQATAKTFSITNSGNQAFAWIGTLGKGSSSGFSFTPTSGTVPANGGTVTVTVTPTAGIPAQASTAPDAFGDVINIVTDIANDSGHVVQLHQTAHGAVLTAAPGSLDFGQVPVNRSSDAPFVLANTGNGPVTVTMTPDNATYSLNPAGPSVLSGGTSLPVTATFAPGTSVLPQNGTVAFAADAGEVLCAPLPASLTVTGQGTSGSVSYTPAALDFGQVSCGTTAAARTVTFTNAGNQAYTVSAALAAGGSSPYAVALAPTSGVASPDGGTVVITVTPSGIPQTSAVTPNLYGDTLTVTTDVVGDSAHDIALRMTAKGSIFALSTNSLSFGSVVVGQSGGAQFTVTNTGNALGGLSFVSGQPAIFALPQDAGIPANASSALVGTFSPTAANNYSDTANIVPAAGTVLCHALPFTTMSLSGSGSSGNVLTLSAQSLTFGTGGLVACGAQGSAKTMTVTNNASATLNLAYALAGGSSSPYTVSGPATVASLATATITITPKAVPATSSTAPDAFADTLSITATGSAVNEVRTVALHETAQGAILSFNPTALSFTGTSTKNFTVNNAGNLSAAFTLALGGANASNFSLTPTSGTAAGGGSATESATYTAPLLGGTKTATVSVTSSATLCAPLPSALTMTGG